MNHTDPSAKICESSDSLACSTETSKFTYKKWNGKKDKIKYSPKFINLLDDDEPVYTDKKLYKQVIKLGDKFGSQSGRAREANPFENIGKSFFSNRAAIKLANCDAVHKLCGVDFSQRNPTSDEEFTYCDIASGPGSFTQYIQYRFPNSIGYGITLTHTKASNDGQDLDWDSRIIDMDKFTPFYGTNKKNESAGDLYRYWRDFGDFVLKEQSDGVDLVMGDGGILIDGRESQQEFVSSRLLLVQILTGIICTKEGGNFITKAFDLVTELSAELLFILGMCFEVVIPFKPVSSRPMNAERYIICKSRRNKIKQYVDILSLAANDYTDSKYIKSMFEISPAIGRYLIDINTTNAKLRIEYLKRAIKYNETGELIEESYNITKFLKIWGL